MPPINGSSHPAGNLDPKVVAGGRPDAALALLQPDIPQTEGCGTVSRT
ncbi:hypothetical protein ACIQWA_14290 [Kitasatospora sp. NPDC098652]